ncbi:hypothetical protein AbaHEU3_16090 [Acinetobacter baumannii]|nr:hypothetical protein AbaHEU3_16090 [Acinetobacter baumannii]
MYNQFVARLITEKLFNLNSCHTHNQVLQRCKIMILDEIQKAYFKNNFSNDIAVTLEISQSSYHEMLKEDDRVIRIGRPNENGELIHMFGRPVKVIASDDFTWRWVKL